MRKSSTIVISDWLMNCRTGQWTPFEAATALKVVLAKEGFGMVQAKPVAWRWRPPGSSSWIYDPTLEWLEEHLHEIEAEPLFADPSRRAADPPEDHGEDRLGERGEK